MFEKFIKLTAVTLIVLLAASGLHARDSVIVANQKDFIASVNTAKPGDAIIIKDGTYANWSVTIEAHGSLGKPIIIRPENKGGVTFTGDGMVEKTMFDIKGSYITFDGFTFKDMTLRGRAGLINLSATHHARFINNSLRNIVGFQAAGGPLENGRMVLLLGEGADNEVAHNSFEGNENVLVLSVRMEEKGISRRTHIHHNIFRNLNMNKGGEGTTTVQLASSGRLGYETLLLQSIVEYNHFENIRGDAETISSKSNANIIRNNSFINTKSLVIRQGHNVVVENNILVGTIGPAIRVHGSGHLVQNNIIKNTKDSGIALNYGMGSGLEAITHRVTVTDGKYINNIIENVEGNGIFLGYGKGRDHTGHRRVKEWNTGVMQDIPPSGNIITGNIILNAQKAPIERAGANDNIIKDNISKQMTIKRNVQ